MSETSNAPRLAHPNGQEFILAGEMTIGRHSDCQIHLNDNLASRRHAQIVVSGQRVTIADLESNNGTWVNDQKVTSPVELRDGDQVRIGSSILTFKSAAPQEAPEKPAEEPENLHTVAWQTGSLMTLVRGSDGAEFGVTRELKIGRDRTNDLQLKDDGSASQHHAQIELVNGQAVVSDLHSSNGTWVNGKRITGKVPLKHGDRIHVGETVFRLRIGNIPLPATDTPAAPQKSTSWLGWAVAIFMVGIVIVLMCAAAIPLLITLTRAEPTATLPPPTPQQAPTPVPSNDTPQDANSAKMDAFKSLALIIVPDQNYNTNDSVYTGSGSFINEDGYILTNFHVIGVADAYEKAPGEKTGDLTNNLYDGEELIVAGINWTNPLAEPDTFYRCEIVESDPYLDLALLRVVEMEDPGSGEFGPLPADLKFPVIPIGNSDDLSILEPITIIGFPGVGGNTPTAIDDQVAGFSPDHETNNEKGWLKTGPIISHGNSGGMAINQKGELIGVPTMIITDAADKIGYIRPINLALPLIQQYLP